jgi:hypothetical protein
VKVQSFKELEIKSADFTYNVTLDINGSLELIKLPSNFSWNLNIEYNNMSASALDLLFTNLPNATATIYINGNPGRDICNQSIATAKGWTIDIGSSGYGYE